MDLVALSPQPARMDARVVLVLFIGAAFGAAVLTPSSGFVGACLFMGGLLVVLAWLAVVGRSRSVFFETKRKMIVVRWRNGVFMRRQRELPLQRFSHVVSYLRSASSGSLWIVVALVERSGDRELVVDSSSSEWKDHGFWSFPDVVEGERARLLRREVSIKTGLADGGYRGACVALPASESVA